MKSIGKFEEEILEYINKDAKYNVYDFERCHIIRHDDKQMLFEITHMYDYGSEDSEKLRSSRLQALAEHFGYTEFEIYDDISSSGCETCDYGSTYGKAIRFWK